MSVVRPRFEPGFPFAADNLWRGANFVVQRLLPKVWDFELVGRNAITEGPLVVAVNHFSHLDPVASAVAAERPARYLGVDELFGQSKFFDGITYYLGVIPMPRGRVPLQAMRAALNHLNEGGAVGLFPEGRRVSEWGESPPKQGAAWLARRMARGLRRTSTARALSVVRGFFRWCAHNRVLENHAIGAVRTPRLPRAVPRPLSEEQALAVLLDLSRR